MMFIRNASLSFALALLATACGPSAAFQAALGRVNGGNRANTSGPRVNAQALCENREERAVNAERNALCVALEQERETADRLATARGTPRTDAGVAAAPTLPAPAQMGAQVVAPQAPAMPPLCPGVDPATVNVPPQSQVFNQGLSFGGQFNGGQSSVEPYVYSQVRNYWLAIVVNEQVAAATTGGFDNVRPSQIAVQLRSGATCIMPAYAPGADRRIHINLRSVRPGQRLQILCIAQQNSAPGIGGIGEVIGGRTIDNWNPMTNPNPPMTDSDCQR